MNGQQFFLGFVALVLCVLAVPGLVMDADTSGTTNQDQEQSQPAETSEGSGDTGEVPITNITAEQVSEERRKEIAFSRKININEVSLDELANSDIQNLGESRAESLIEFRDSLDGPIKCIDQLTGAHRIGESYVEDWSESLTVGKEYLDAECPSGGGSGGKININEANKKRLTELTGIGDATAETIVNYRKSNGSFESVDDLESVKGIGPSTIEDIQERAVVE